MKKDKTGGQAFPAQEGFSFKTGEAEQAEIGTKPGMTLLDYFAGKALTRIISKEILSDVGHQDDYFQIIARESYSYAEAMIKEREKWME